MRRLLIALLLLCPAADVMGADGEIFPFQINNQSPLVQVYAVPRQSGADIVPAGRFSYGLSQDLSSNYTFSSNDQEQILLDGETYRLALELRYGIAERWEIGVEIPYLIQGGGFLDSFVIDWHNTFGLPQGGRENAPKNRLTYRYSKDGIRKLDMDHVGSGVGDISLTGGYRLYDVHDAGKHDRLALKAAIKLPTGNSAYLRGSGGTDALLQLCGSMTNATGWGALGVYGSVGGLVMSPGDVLRDQHNPLAGVGSFGIGWGPAAWLTFKLQLNGTTPLYHGSSLAELSRSSLLLTSGGSVRLPGGYLLDIGVGEDVAVATAPDVSFQLGLRKDF